MFFLLMLFFTTVVLPGQAPPPPPETAYVPRPPREKAWLDSDFVRKNPLPWQISSGLLLAAGTAGTLWYGWKSINDLPGGFLVASEQQNIVLTGVSLLVAAVAGLVFTAFLPQGD